MNEDNAGGYEANIRGFEDKTKGVSSWAALGTLGTASDFLGLFCTSLGRYKEVLEHSQSLHKGVSRAVVRNLGSHFG